MKRKIVLAMVLCLALVSLAALAAAPVGAVIGGQQDTGNKYSNVGMNLEFGYFDPGLWGFAGSCTLVKNDPGPGNVVVMTAAHNVWDESPAYVAENWLVTFDPLTDDDYDDWFVTIPDGLPAGLETYKIEAVMMHPGFDVTTMPYTGVGGSKPNVIGPGREDVALMWLDRRVVVPGTKTPVTAAPIVGLGGLEGLDDKGETFTVVGYGFSDVLAGSAASFMAGGGGVMTWNGRNYGDASVASEHDAFGDRFLKLTSSASSFDSGGAVLHGGAIAGLPALGSNRYASPVYVYRLDTASAQGFLNCWLDHKGLPR